MPCYSLSSPVSTYLTLYVLALIPVRHCSHVNSSPPKDKQHSVHMASLCPRKSSHSAMTIKSILLCSSCWSSPQCWKLSRVVSLPVSGWTWKFISVLRIWEEAVLTKIWNLWFPRGGSLRICQYGIWSFTCLRPRSWGEAFAIRSSVSSFVP